MNQIELDLSFPTNYICEVLLELPNGKLKHYFYPNGTTEGGKDGILISIYPHRDKWLGTFYGEVLSSKSLNKVLSWPDPDKICVVSLGTGFIVDVNNPEKFEIVDLVPLLQVISSKEHGLIIFASYTNLIAYNRNGVLWKTNRISWDGLKITGLSESFLEGEYQDIRSDSDVNFKVNLSSGDLEDETGKFIS